MFQVEWNMDICTSIFKFKCIFNPYTPESCPWGTILLMDHKWKYAAIIVFNLRINNHQSCFWDPLSLKVHLKCNKVDFSIFHSSKVIIFRKSSNLSLKWKKKCHKEADKLGFFLLLASHLYNEAFLLHFEAQIYNFLKI